MDMRGRSFLSERAYGK